MSGIAPLVESPRRDRRIRRRSPRGSSICRTCSFSTAPPAAARRSALGRIPFSRPTPPSWSGARARSTEVAAGRHLAAGRGRRARRRARDAARTRVIEPVPGLPPFQGGVAGYIGYDYGAVLERLPADPLRRSRAARRRPRALRLGDRLGPPARQRPGSSPLGLPECGPERERRARERMEMVRERCVAGRRRAEHARPTRCRGDALRSGRSRPPRPTPSPPPTPPCAIGLRSTFTHRGYLDAVARVREYIVAGDIFQANLSQRFQAPLREPPFELYRRLRRRNPAPFAAYLGFDDVTVLSASPERFLRLDHDAPGGDPADQGHAAARARARCTTRPSAGRWRRARRTGPRTS